jgi:hypothetical protein
MTWWDALMTDPRHRFFRDERNSALKEVAMLVEAARLDLADQQTVIFWAFSSGPFKGQPLLPRCQQYTEWLYFGLLAPACERLFAWIIDDQ